MQSSIANRSSSGAYARARLKEIIEKNAGRDGQSAVHRLDGQSDTELGEDSGRDARKPSVNERLKDVLNQQRENWRLRKSAIRRRIRRSRRIGTSTGGRRMVSSF